MEDPSPLRSGIGKKCQEARKNNNLIMSNAQVCRYVVYVVRIRQELMLISAEWTVDSAEKKSGQRALTERHMHRVAAC